MCSEENSPSPVDINLGFLVRFYIVLNRITGGANWGRMWKDITIRLVRTGRGMFFEDGIARRGGRYCVVGEQVTL